MKHIKIMKHIKTVKYIKIAMGAALGLAFTACCIIVNTIFPASVITEAAMHEELEFNGVSYMVTECNEMPRELSDYYYSAARGSLGGDITYLVKMHVKNTDDISKKLSLGGFGITRNDYANFSDLMLFLDMNDDTNLYLDSGEEKDFTLTFTIHQVGFSDEQWKNIRNSKFQLVLALHPQKLVINLY